MSSVTIRLRQSESLNIQAEEKNVIDSVYLAFCL